VRLPCIRSWRPGSIRRKEQDHSRSPARARTSFASVFAECNRVFRQPRPPAGADHRACDGRSGRGESAPPIGSRGPSNLSLGIAVDLAPDSIQQSYAFTVCFRHGPLFNLPLVSYVAYGVWGFALGNLIVQTPRTELAWGTMAGAALLTDVVLRLVSAPASGLLQFLSSTSRFALSLVLALVISRLAVLRPSASLFSLLGRWSLFVYLTHRVIQQTGFHLLQATLAPEALAPILLVVTGTGCATLCWGREWWTRRERLDGRPAAQARIATGWRMPGFLHGVSRPAARRSRNLSTRRL
jgi:hypothetical protein